MPDYRKEHLDWLRGELRTVLECVNATGFSLGVEQQRRLLEIAVEFREEITRLQYSEQSLLERIKELTHHA